MNPRTKLFTTNRSQAVRIPKALAFPPDVKEVEITQVGDTRVITPVKNSWAEYFANGPFATEDFLSERMQLDFDDREPLP